MIDGSTILVTGGTGSWGQELVKQLLDSYAPKEVRVFSRGEYKQVEMSQEFDDPRLKFIIGDIRDRGALDIALRGVDIVFHLAALKQVPICEEHCEEAVLTNINGTKNIIDLAITHNIKKVVEISTDKAVEPLNFYGITKACGERMIVNANNNFSFNEHTSFVSIRAGNVMGTQGSVIPLFKKQIKSKNKITVTDENMTRFLMSTKEAIALVFKAVEASVGGEIFVMRMSAAKMKILNNVMIKLFGNKDTKVENIGIRHGEKMHEVLISKNEMSMAKVFSDKYFVVLPQYDNHILERKYRDLPTVDLEEYNSLNTHNYNEGELEQVLRNEKWLMN